MPVLFEAPPPAPKKPAKRTKSRISDMPKRSNPLTAYAYKPLDIRFETQEEDEDVILFLRQHIVVMVPSFCIFILMLLAPVVVFPLFMQLLELPIDIPASYILVGTVFWYLASFGFIFTQFLHWFFNIFIVTNRRIIDIDFVNLLYKEFSEAPISRIQDLSYQTKGILGTMFNYGNVLIQTAGEVPNFVFESVPKPSAAVDVLSDLLHMTKGEDV